MLIDQSVEVAAETSVSVEHVGEQTLEQLYPDEVGRWIRLASAPILCAAICVALAFGTSFPYFWGGVIFFGAGVNIFVIIYLSLSCDTNAASGHGLSLETSAHHLETYGHHTLEAQPATVAA